jgi:hypothetical protein
MKRFIWLGVLFLLILLSACAASTRQNTPVPQNTLAAIEGPEWIKNLVVTYMKDPVGNPPRSIWQYSYKGQTVYYFPPQCCDQFSMLYNAKMQVLCAPDGGITGKGDEKCPDFFQERKDEKLIWKDARK